MRLTSYISVPLGKAELSPAFQLGPASKTLRPGRNIAKPSASALGTRQIIFPESRRDDTYNPSLPLTCATANAAAATGRER